MTVPKHIWLVRAGRHGEHESKFLFDSRVYLTWPDIGIPLDKLDSRAELRRRFAVLFPAESPETIRVWATEVWNFSHDASEGDLIVVPSYLETGMLDVGEIIGKQDYDPEGDTLYRHFRAVKWIGRMSRSSLPHPLKRSLNSRLTISRMAEGDEGARREFARAVASLAGDAVFKFRQDAKFDFLQNSMAYENLTASEIQNAFGGALEMKGVKLESGACEFIALAFRSFNKERHQLWRDTPGGVERWLQTTYVAIPAHLLFAAGRPDQVEPSQRDRLEWEGFKSVSPRLEKVGFFELQHYVELNIVAFSPFPRHAG